MGNEAKKIWYIAEEIDLNGNWIKDHFLNAIISENDEKAIEKDIIDHTPFLPETENSNNKFRFKRLAEKSEIKDLENGVTP